MSLSKISKGLSTSNSVALFEFLLYHCTLHLSFNMFVCRSHLHPIEGAFLHVLLPH